MHTAVFFVTVLSSAASGQFDVSRRLEQTDAFIAPPFVYLKCRTIAHTASSCVYEAALEQLMAGGAGWDSTTAPRVAVKCSRSSSPSDNSGYSMQQEAARLEQLAGFSWNLKFLDHFVYHRMECIVMELGGSRLSHVLTSSVGLATRLAISHRMVDIVEELHMQGFTHADIHIDQWLMGSWEDLGSLKLIDFGRGGSLDPENIAEEFMFLSSCIVHDVLKIELDEERRWTYISDLLQVSPGVTYSDKIRHHLVGLTQNAHVPSTPPGGAD